MKLAYKDFDLPLSIASGQCFEWKKVSDFYYGEIFPGSIIKIRQLGTSQEGELEYEIFGKAINKSDIKRYFSLETDYKELVASFNKDENINKAINHLHGLRLVNQNPWRCLNSFIISANNTVLNITRSVERLSINYGDKVETDIGLIDIFPQLHKWKNISEQDFRDLKLGFRSKYLAKIPEHINSTEEYFDKLLKSDYKGAKQILTQIPGIGSKVADCILLYSLSKHEAYPVDVWLRRVTHEVYFSTLENKPNDEDLRDWALNYFGPKAGIAHMFLFVYRRSIGVI